MPASDALRLMPQLKTIFVLACAAVALAGCAQQPSNSARGRSKEYFSSSIYGAASPRVVADGEAVPRGGGRYLVGRPYTIAGRRYVPSEQPRATQIGMASYYGAAFHGRRTANGEVYDMSSISAAHPTMPLPSYARVTNVTNGRSIIVRVNDRGPFHSNRVMDVSQRVAQALDFRRMGTAQVKID
jgi:rare lipoprotein A